jgi:uncharacterized protein (TIGR03546 family)
MILKWFVKIFVALNANTNPAQIAGAAAAAFLVALLPAGNLVGFLILVVFFFIKINNVFLCILMPVFMSFTHVFDGILNTIGYAVLSIPQFENFFTGLNNFPLVPFTSFNNTLVAGALVSGIILFVPVFLLTHLLVTLYRKQVRDKIAASKFAKAFTNIPAVAKIIQIASGVRSAAFGG